MAEPITVKNESFRLDISRVSRWQRIKACWLLLTQGGFTVHSGTLTFTPSDEEKTYAS